MLNLFCYDSQQCVGTKMLVKCEGARREMRGGYSARERAMCSYGRIFLKFSGNVGSGKNYQ